jgi:hypothetical protein
MLAGDVVKRGRRGESCTAHAEPIVKSTRKGLLVGLAGLDQWRMLEPMRDGS